MTQAWTRTFFPAVAFVAVSAACGGDLDECDMTAAQELVFSDNGLVATKGQALLHDSCGNGAFCHSSAAKGGARHGAPASMNFDMLPSPTGWPELIDRRDDVWDQIDSGHMPPGDVGRQVQGDNGWVFDRYHGADAPKLPAVTTPEGKAVVRNWLACGAPLVSDVHVPQWARGAMTPSGAAGQDMDFSGIYTSILRPNCATAGCHNASAAGGLDMGDACKAYSQLMKTGACGKARVVGSDGNSLLLDKISSSKPSCGGPMPPTGMLPSDKIARIRAWISAGAPSASCSAATTPSSNVSAK